MSALYSEWEPYPAAWLRNLIAAGHIAPGRVDERSIAELAATDVLGHGQRHFFAGIAGWSHALRLAGVPDDADVWTGSCPCQPFSVAGKGKGVDDDRHLWPVWFDLIAECRPAIVFGEQVAGKAGRAWLAAVRADLERVGYAVGAADLAAASVGAPHIRQRHFFGAVRLADGDDREQASAHDNHRRHAPWHIADGRGSHVRLADGEEVGRGPWRSGITGNGASIEPRGCSASGRMGDADREHAGRDGRGARRAEAAGDCSRGVDGRDGDESRASGRDRGPWDDAEWIVCTDGKARPAQPGSFPLADGVPARVGKLRAYGNAIVPEVAAEFVRAFLDAVSEQRSAA